MDKSAFVEVLEARSSSVKPRWRPTLKKSVLRKQAHVQVLFTDLQTALDPCGFRYSLPNFGAATSTMRQGIWEESCPPAPWVAGPSTCVSTVDSKVS